MGNRKDGDEEEMTTKKTSVLEERDEETGQALCRTGLDSLSKRSQRV